jgi:hypothetical protein
VLIFLAASALSLSGREAGVPAGAVAPDVEGVRRLVAIGDVHGDHRAFTALLKKAGLVDEALRWAGGDAVLVQTGDILDRGPQSRQALELVIKLESEAAAAGGKVLMLLGNHEVMNVIGDLRYLHARELEPYAGEESPEQRARALEELREFVARPKPLLASPFYQRFSASLKSIGEGRAFPPGYVLHRRLFAPSGRYGKWLLGKPALVKVDRSLFLHAGLSPEWGALPFSELRRRFRDDLEAYLGVIADLERLGVFHPLLGYGELLELKLSEEATRKVSPELAPLFARLDALFKGPVFEENGPIWYRGMAQESEAGFRGAVRAILTRQDADRIVIGHTQPLDLHIQSRFDGGVVVIDTGMNHEVYRGHPEALEIRDGKALKIIAAAR